MAAKLDFETEFITEILKIMDDKYKECFYGGNWIEQANKLGVNTNNEFVEALKKVKQYFKVSIYDEDKNGFKYTYKINYGKRHYYRINDFEKKLAIMSVYGTSDYRNFNSIVAMSNILFDYEQSEIKFNKPLYEFNDDEVIEAINNSIKGFAFNREYVLKKLTLILEYISQCGIKITETSWGKYSESQEIKKIIKTNTRIVDVLTEDFIFNYIYWHRNLQISIVPLMAYSGMSFKEAVNLKTTDIENDGVTLSDGKRQRFLPLSAKIIDILRKAANTKEAIGSDGRIVCYYESIYVLKSTKSATAVTTASRSAIFQRLEEFTDYIEADIGEQKITYTIISNVGMFHYTDKLIEQGMNKDEAIYNTFAKFGDWEYSGYEDGVFLNIERTPWFHKKVERYLEKERQYRG
ncbi:hypothetical protein [Tuanshanicoccus lijuaniae]|uniref:hypothetical protein n=1 Tax=Aerococcaceae bacterium zg-1292 TaxID=2774330 RepID=UPI001BD86581|nr:hypothetical protein [Aerococcaceae bacterium zg-A91]MBS4458457.1 hypothetical protein [Aerococcaceae bacterium zg-BR33]